MSVHFNCHCLSQGEDFSLSACIETKPYLPLCVQGPLKLSTVVTVTRYWFPVTRIAAVVWSVRQLPEAHRTELDVPKTMPSRPSFVAL
jgi:hypothetical protein